jgi:hypothetical protein
MVRRQIGVAEARHAFSTATAGIGRAGAKQQREQRDCENFQHGYLFSCMMPVFVNMVTNIASSIEARKLCGGGSQRV